MSARAIKPRRLPAAAPSRALVLRYKAATRRMIDAAGDLDGAAALCGLSRSQLSRCQSPHDPDLLPPHALLLLASTTGADGMAEMFRDLATPVADRADSPFAAAASVLSESAEAIHLLGQAMADGVMTGREQAEIRETFADLRHALAALDAYFDGLSHGRSR